MHHLDMAHRGSVFTVQQQPVKRATVLLICINASLVAAFAQGLHLVDDKSLTKLGVLLAAGIVSNLWFKTFSESILILPSLGLQVQTCNYLGHVCTRFFCLSQIKDIVINEAVTMNSILTYVVVLLKDDDCSGQAMLYPLFRHSWPRVKQLQQVYQVCQEKLLQRHTQ